MQIIAPTRRFEYVLEDDRNSQAQTVFLLRRLSWEELLSIQRAAGSSVSPHATGRLLELTAAARDEKRELSQQEIESLMREIPDWSRVAGDITDFNARIARAGVEKISGLIDEQGKPITMPPEEFIRWAPPEVVNELGGEILRLSQLSETERKNSPAPPEPGA